MKIPLMLVVALSTLSAFAAVAPDSISGRVLQQTSIDIHTSHSSKETTIIFGTDGRFTTLFVGGGPDTAQPAYSVFFGIPRPDGTYTYTRVDETTGRIALNYGDGTTESIDLTFTSQSGGTDAAVGASYSFSLSDPAVITSAPALNASLRGNVDVAHPLIAGFVVPGTPAATPIGFLPAAGFVQREVLIRVVGPSLAQFGVTGTWADPDFKLFNGNSAAKVNEVHYFDWAVTPTISGGTPAGSSPTSTLAFQKIFTYAGAFPLLPNSKDAVALVRLNPGTYTIVASAVQGDTGGTAIIEVYFLP